MFSGYFWKVVCIKCDPDVNGDVSFSVCCRAVFHILKAIEHVSKT